MNIYLLAGLIVLAIACGIAGLIIRTRIANSSDGERWMRQRMQGPFAPLGNGTSGGDRDRAEPPNSHDHRG